MKSASLQTRVVTLVLGPAAVIAVALTWYFLYGRFDDLERALLDRGRTIARQLGPAAQYGLFAGDRQELGRLALTALNEADVVAVTIHDSQHQALASVGVPSVPHSAITENQPLQEFALPHSSRHIFSVPVLGTRAELEPWFEGDRPQRALGTITVEMSRSALENRKRRQLHYGLAVVLAVLMVSTLAALRMSRRITRPIRQLSHTVSALSRGDFSVRAPESAQAEILVLERGVNVMAGALAASHQHLQARITEATAELAMQKEQAEQASAAKTRFLAAASHDLRQPMQALGLWVSALRAKAKDPAVLDMGVKIDASVNALGEMLNALLDISKLDAGAVRVDLGTVSLDFLFDRLELQFEPSARAKGLALHVRRSGLHVSSDPVLLHRVLHNLLSNAIKYTVKGRVLLCARRCDHHVRIEVRDSGPGIAQTQQSLIFEEFFQLGNSERDRNKGLGLGLAIVQRVTRLLGQPCQVRSAPGCGATFSVSVPRAVSLNAATPPAEAGDTADLAALYGRLIAVLDDDRLVRHSLADLLQGMGCSTLLAANGAELHRRIGASTSRPDLLICDYRLPQGEKGVDVINQVRASLGKDFPCLLISGDLTPDTSALLNTRHVKLLQKPVSTQRLARELLKLLDD